MFDQMTLLSLSQVFKNIQCEVYQIKSVSASKSDVWTKFGPVTMTDGVNLEFTAFKSCHAVFTYCGRKTYRHIHYETSSKERLGGGALLISTIAP